MLDISGTMCYDKSRYFAEKLDTAYPFLTCLVIGRSFSGKAVFSFSVGNKNNSVIITGTKSAQTSLILYKFTENVCESELFGKELSGVDFSALVRKFGITVVPCLNPDFDETVLGNYGAPESGYNSKESETPTRAFVSLCRRHNFRSCLTLGSGANSIYYRREHSPVSSLMMAKILASPGFFGVSEKEMPPCPSRWFADEFLKPSFLIETTEEKDTLSLYKKLEETLVLMSVM